MKKNMRAAGRPTTTPLENVKATLGIRASAKLKTRLIDQAKMAGRSLSQEAEVRLEESFDRQDLLSEVLTLSYGPILAGLLLAMAGAIRATTAGAAVRRILTAAKRGEDFALSEVIGESMRSWHDNPYAFNQALKAAIGVMSGMAPAGDVDVDPKGMSPQFIEESKGLGERKAGECLRAIAGDLSHDFEPVTSALKAKPLLGSLVERISIRQASAPVGEQG